MNDARFVLTPMAAALALLSLGGCAATGSPDWDSRFGDRNRQLSAQQLLDPRAPERNAQAVPRADGRTLRDGMDRHGESYRSPPPTNVINIGVGK